MAHMTGHKQTSRKNKKKRAAIEKSSGKTARGRGQPPARQRTQPKKKSTKTFFDPSTHPDYPLGPSQNAAAAASSSAATSNRAVVVPPALILPTASPHVFVTKAACQDAGVHSRDFFRDAAVSRHADANHNTYTFEYFPPASFPNSTTTTSFPISQQPEVAFLGRSNVGKSSLINALMRRTLAVTSKKPGRTQQAYYYGWMPHNEAKQGGRATATAGVGAAAAAVPSPSAASGFLVDLPGYGYAVGPDGAVASWQSATQDFLLQRRDAGPLRRVYLLQDARLAAPQPIDNDVLGWLDEAEIMYTIVLTKADGHRDGHGSGSTAGVVKHANLCSLRYQQQWAEAAFDFAEYDGNGNVDDGSGVAANESRVDGADDDGGDDDDDDNNDAVDDEEGDEEGDEEDDEEEGEHERSAVTMSPMIHVTSAKKRTGLAELLSSIEAEFSVAKAASQR